MQSPEEIAQQIVGDVTYLGSGRVDESDYPDWNKLASSIAAALQSFGDERATAERERCLELIIDLTASSEIANAIAAIRALDT